MRDAVASFDGGGGWSAACSACVGNKRCLLIAALLSALVIIRMSTLTYHAPSLSVDLTSYDGIDPGHAARVVSPSFNITLRLNNTCVDSVDVAVMYSGVALGWARVETRDGAEGRWGRDVDVVARGRGVGLSPRLRDRMASDWRRLGKLELDVDVKTYGEGHHADTDIPQNMILEKVTIVDENKRLFDM